MAKVLVAVTKNNLLYKIPGFKKGKSFTPKVGEVIPLSKELATLEFKSGNVRKVLPEEKEIFLKKLKKSKKKEEE